MRVVLGIGSNLGDRLAHLGSAVTALSTLGTSLQLSPVVETDPVGGPDQPDYLNAVVTLDLPDDTDLLALVNALESARDRTREVRWGPRTLDVDVVSVEGVTSADPALTLPHPRAHLRAFVLVPWAAIDPAAVIPGRGAVADLLAALPAEDLAGVRPRADLSL